MCETKVKSCLKNQFWKQSRDSGTVFQPAQVQEDSQYFTVIFGLQTFKVPRFDASFGIKPGNYSDADTSANILQFQRRQDVGRPEQLQNGGFFTVRQDHRADICFGRNSKEQHSKSSFSSNIPQAAERLSSSQNLNVLHGRMKDSRHGPPDPTVRNSLCESRHSN